MADITPRTPTDMKTFADLAREVLGPGETLGFGDLPRVKLPAGGGTTWELPTGEPAKHLDGIIVHRQTTRAYWPDTFGAGDTNAPACSSTDGVRGIGDPGGECASCPLAQFGSAANGNGQACRVITRLYVLPDGAPAPWVVLIPPSSAAATRRYVVGLLATRGIPYWRVRTRIGLEKAQSGAGITYSIARFTTLDVLDGAEAMAADEMHASIAAMAAAMTPATTTFEAV